MGKATGGLVQQGFCNSGAKRHQFTFCASIKICILVESFGFDLPAIAKPRNVVRNLTKKNLQIMVFRKETNKTKFNFRI